MTDAGRTQDYLILPAPPVVGLLISQDWLDSLNPLDVKRQMNSVLQCFSFPLPSHVVGIDTLAFCGDDPSAKSLVDRKKLFGLFSQELDNCRISLADKTDGITKTDLTVMSV